MLLLHTRTFQLRGFEGRDIPKYAILSHTWGDDEILFQDLSEPQSPTWRQKQAFGKVAGSCRKASDHGYDWIWIDTCCIDKSSSAELSEAINSMFRYYKDSAECYVYMADLEPGRKLHSGNRWFTRGWTLQELIAPSDVRFYNSSWGYIGNKLCLSEDLAFITGVDAYVLEQGDCAIHYTPENWVENDRNRWKRCNCPHDIVPIQDVLASTSTARIMSWASKRETKKEEDIAYSLIGLFDVNIPLLYGEGSKAFIRLQHEIVRKRKDQSILAWRNPLVQLPPYRDFWNNSREISPLAPSPSMFRPDDDIGASTNVSVDGLDYLPPSMSFIDGSLTMDVLLCPLKGRGTPPKVGIEIFAAILDATMGSNPLCRPVILICRDIQDHRSTDDRFRRLSNLMYCVSGNGSGEFQLVGGESAPHVLLDMNQVAKRPVTFINNEERRHTDFQKSMSMVQVKLRPPEKGNRSPKYDIDWRNCKESNYVLLFEHDIKNNFKRIRQWKRNGVVSFVSTNSRYPPFVVVWVLQRDSDRSTTSEGKHFCKIWSHRGLIRQFSRENIVSPLEIAQYEVDEILSGAGVYDATWDSRITGDAVILDDWGKIGETIAITAWLQPRTFLERTVLELELDIKLVERAYSHR
ncbi:hypothetical protein TruAng_009184 [Truncatella angustata]|nr:hypothetical protein TruAng_009184 [Truncatella angustata]